MEDQFPIVPTTHGYIKGAKKLSILKQSYYSFEKIPYAQPPLNELRFKPPADLKPWSDILDCTQCGEKPLQKNSITGQLTGSEDCLYLNVYVKDIHSTTPMPVMVYIYGGAFQNGGATADKVGPDYFMQKNVILVTLNYRVGPLGFLSLSDPKLQVPGNAGLKDQLAALRWIKANCINFNGDHQNITLFGNSAGGGSTHLLMLTPQSKGLFQKAILMSGCAFNTWSLIPQNDGAYRLAKHLGYEDENNDAKVLQFLRQQDGQQLAGLELRTLKERLEDVSYCFAPTVEPYVNEHTLLGEHPHQLMANAWSNALPVMLGGTSFESLYGYKAVLADPSSLERIGKHPQLVIPYAARSGKSEEQCQQEGQEIIKHYFGNKPIGMQTILEYLKLLSERVFWLGFYRLMKYRLSQADKFGPTYVYRFDFESPHFSANRKDYIDENIKGVEHAAELCYLFYGSHGYHLAASEDSLQKFKSSREFKAMQRMIEFWYQFASKSNPNAAGQTAWQPLSAEEPAVCCNIADEVQQMVLPHLQILELWNKSYGDM